MKPTFSTLVAVLLALCVLSTGATAGEKKPGKSADRVSTPTGSPVRTYLNINNISTVFKNTGRSDIDVFENNSGFVYPKGSGKTAVFESGFLWGGKIAGETRVGGSTYSEGLQGGKILSPGLAEDPNLPKNRIYRVRRDERPGSEFDANLSSEMASEGLSEDAIRTQYETDWTEWPVADGAPYEDVDSNGVWEPDTDIPGVKGADQTIWFVANDLDPGKTQDLYGSTPMGIEMQATIWAYAQQGALGNMFFRKYVIINKSLTAFDSMYVSMWSDVDLGNASDDYSGCDTNLSLGFTYNANANDATYNPLPPPAVGFDFFQGPLVDAPGESGISNGQVVADKKNLPMTAFYYFANGDLSVTDPTLASYEGTEQFYNFFQGKIGITGEYFVNPITEQPTTFALPGDAQTGSGWVDGNLLPAGDRRIGLASGPFTMAAGDTQEIVVAEIVAGAQTGVDRLSAIGLLKFYDLQAQLAYDNFFDLPTPPPAPNVTITELDREILLDWSKDADRVEATESSNAKGYSFQGYNIYQLPSASASISEGERVATFDVNDGVGKIFGLTFDPNTGSVVVLPTQFGNDSYVQRYLSITQDARTQTTLINGIRYYYAVTAYSYNPDPLAVPNTLETPPTIFTVTPHTLDPGDAIMPGGVGATPEATHTGTADGSISVSVVDPEALTGDDYQVTFSQQAEIRDASGNWVPSSIVTPRTRAVADPDTVIGSTIDIAGKYGVVGGQFVLHCVLNIVSPEGAFVEAMQMTFPPGVALLNVPAIVAGNADPVPAVINGNTVTWGDTTHPYTQNGPFAGGEEWDITVTGSIPLPVDWKIYDDGYLDTPADAEGTTEVVSVGYFDRIAKYWNVVDTTRDSVVLANQSVVLGTDLYPDRDDIPTNPGLPASPVVDGFQVSVDVGYAAPINYFDVELESPSGLTDLTSSSSTTTLDIQNYTIFGGTITSKSIDNFGVGTNALNELQKDYELRFTGVLDTTVSGGKTLISVSSGGQWATIFRGVNGTTSLSGHPFNPNPGVAQPFLIRIPFEVWSKDDNRQVNLTFRDRTQDTSAATFYSWNLVNRMYAIIVNSAYDSTQVIQVDGGPDAFNAPATWVLVMYGTNYHLGDVVDVTYANPIQIGVDHFDFSTVGKSYSSELAASQVDQINVFPNPYYAVNTEEINKYQRFVTFSHLPSRATLRIFNLAGVLVRTIEKDDEGQFQRWDLSNESGLPVASGMYVAYIDLPDLGTTRVVKLSIIQERQILDRF